MPPMSRLLATAALALAAPAWADGGISLAVESGTIGAEPVAGVRLSPFLGAHGDAALLGVSHHLMSGTALDFDYYKLRTAAAMVDMFPLGGGLRVSAGARYEGERAPMGSSPARVGRGRQQAGWTSVAPIVALGWTRRFARGLVAVMEAGTTFRRGAALPAAALRASPVAQVQLGWRF